MKRTALTLIILVVALPGIPAGAGETTGAAPEVIVSAAEFPTNMAFSPDGRLFYVEKDTGNVRIVEEGRLQGQPFAHLDVTPGGETGLLGIAIPHDFARDPWVYVYLSNATTGNNEIVRIRAEGNVGGAVQPVLTALPTESGYHNGGDIMFGPDGTLYVTVGEVHESARAQDPNDLGGKILRITATGEPAPDGPFGEGNPVYSMGHRNSFGICFAPDGQLYETENGPDSHDEVNRIVAGGNYGWPEVMGPGGGPRFIDPIWDFPQVVVPTGCAVVGRTLYWGDFSGRIYALSLDPSDDGAEAVIVEDLGVGITDLQVGPGGELNVATTDSIIRLASLPGTGTGSESPASGASPTPAPKGNRFETYAAWATGALALLIVVLGGLWFRGLSRREGPTPGA